MPQKIWTGGNRQARRRKAAKDEQKAATQSAPVIQLVNEHAAKLRAVKAAIGGRQCRKQMKALRKAAREAA